MIEVDSEAHHKYKTIDDSRDAFLSGLGYSVLRVMGREIGETPALVLKTIAENLEINQDELVF